MIKVICQSCMGNGKIHYLEGDNIKDFACIACGGKRVVVRDLDSDCEFFNKPEAFGCAGTGWYGCHYCSALVREKESIFNE